MGGGCGEAQLWRMWRVCGVWLGAGPCRDISQYFGVNAGARHAFYSKCMGARVRCALQCVLHAKIQCANSRIDQSVNARIRALRADNCADLY